MEVISNQIHKKIIPQIDLSGLKNENPAPRYNSLRSIKRKKSIPDLSQTLKHDTRRPFNTERKILQPEKPKIIKLSEFNYLMKKELQSMRLAKNIKEQTLKTSLLNSVCKQVKKAANKNRTSFSKITTMASENFLDADETKDLLKKDRDTERSLANTERFLDGIFKSQGLIKTTSQSFFKSKPMELTEIQNIFMKGESPRRVSKQF